MEKQEIFTNLHYLPIFIFVSVPASFIITYTIAVVKGHVVPGFPYISDTGTYPPESCLFAQFLNIIAVIMAISVYVRYGQLKEISSTYQLSAYWQKINKITLILGMITSIGMSIAGNFQETSNLIIHLCGAFTCFGCGTAYISLQAVYSYRLQPLGCSPKITILRLGLSIFCTISFFVVIIGAGLALKDYKGNNPRTWSPEDGGWEMHLLSTISEWLLAIAICIFLLSFTHEFREIEMTYPKITYKEDYAKKMYGLFNASPESISPTTKSHQTSSTSAGCQTIYGTLTPEKSDKLNFNNGATDKFEKSSINYEFELPRSDSCSKIINCLTESDNQDYNQIFLSDLDEDKMLLSHNNIEIRSTSNSSSTDNSIAASIKSDEDIDTELSCCDIEQCLIQIEESLLNIEQNLLHVQNLEIPQLNNLLNNRFIINNYNRNNDYVNKYQINPLSTYKRPSSENSKYNYSNYFDNNSTSSLVRSCLRLSHSDSDIDIEKNIYLNSPRHDCRLDNDDFSYNKYSSLLKKSQTLIEDNFKKIQLLSEIKSDFINLNCSDSLGRSVKLINSKNLCNSFDNNGCNSFKDNDNDYDNEDYDITRVKEILGKKKRINSLSNYFCKSNSISSSSLINSRKTSSQGAIEKYTRDNGFKVRKKRRDICRRSINNTSSDGLLNQINGKSDLLRKKFKTVATTKDIVMSFKKLQACNSKGRNLMIQDFDCETKNEDDKKKVIDKPLKNSTKNQLQANDNNALVPSKLLSLSFSLLLAALLQAVRCLADIVEDTFRSVTFDKYVLRE
ncbi:Similar to Dram2: DNA damage-regulated autophagy modulator protein 2 (Mus musculus) [Cotesia congregata]|uniref:Similar to Dram2: DNA damage-regulated autophagy modulator protein 2 (Mus musculus) n=1 Tax=Cotesia congregata TaxID=51543 RepID=A0A8J2HIT0_COTCN|nr:Similar to Dram2: DNA damage-regulated autophagy modulator protein 2 (Mus musculus) [Cotesia congregata]